MSWIQARASIRQMSMPCRRTRDCKYGFLSSGQPRFLSSGKEYPASSGKEQVITNTVAEDAHRFKQVSEHRARYRNRWMRQSWTNLDVFELDSTGALRKTCCSLSSLHEVHARDLKALDHTANFTRPPTIMPRKECIICSISHISCIIFKDRVIILNPERPVVSYFANHLSLVLRNYQIMRQAEQDWLKYRKAKGRPTSDAAEPLEPLAQEWLKYRKAKRRPSSNAAEPLAQEWLKYRKAKGRPTSDPAQLLSQDLEVAFEFRVLETILRFICTKYENRLGCMQPVINNLLLELGEYDNPRTDQFDRLLGLKTALSAFERGASDLDELLEELLKSEEDMLEMFLTEKSKSGYQRLPVETHDSLELMLETYSREISNFKTDAFFLRKKCETTEDLMRLALDSYRNKMIRIQVKLAQASTGLACGTIFTGMFGMNLLSGFETDPVAFYGAGGIAVGLSVAMYYAVFLVWGRASLQTKAETLHLGKIQAVMDRLGDIQDFVLSKMPQEGFQLQALLEVLNEASESNITSDDVKLVFEFYDRDGDNRLSPGEVMQFLCDNNIKHYRLKEGSLALPSGRQGRWQQDLPRE